MNNRIENSKLLIIDGHGSTSNQTFLFKREEGKKSKIYSWTFEGIPTRVRGSNIKIDEALRTNIIPDGFADLSDSRINPQSGIKDRVLYAKRNDCGDTETELEWPCQAPGNYTQTEIVINGVGLYKYEMNDKILIEIIPGSNETIKLSDIVEYFSDYSYDFLWMVCRSDL